jgi:hypothetical protein
MSEQTGQDPSRGLSPATTRLVGVVVLVASIVLLCVGAAMSFSDHKSEAHWAGVLLLVCALVLLVFLGWMMRSRHI